MAESKRCIEYIERRGKGLRYVYGRRQCANRTTHPSGLCWRHGRWWDFDTRSKWGRGNDRPADA